MTIFLAGILAIFYLFKGDYNISCMTLGVGADAGAFNVWAN